MLQVNGCIRKGEKFMFMIKTFLVASEFGVLALESQHKGHPFLKESMDEVSCDILRVIYAVWHQEGHLATKIYISLLFSHGDQNLWAAIACNTVSNSCLHQKQWWGWKYHFKMVFLDLICCREADRDNGTIDGCNVLRLIRSDVSRSTGRSVEEVRILGMHRLGTSGKRKSRGNWLSFVHMKRPLKWYMCVCMVV